MLVSAHGNSLRALIMALDGLTPDEVVKLELATGVPVVYRLNEDSTRGGEGDPERLGYAGSLNGYCH